MAHGVSPTTASDVDAAGRPTTSLPTMQLVRLSLYWFGLSSIFSGLTVILSGRIQFAGLGERGSEGTTLFLLSAAGTFIAALVQPTVGSISDYTISRWGRRKPYIFIGSVLDVVFLYGIATQNTIIGVAAFMVLLQVSANFAQGPFQGYVPDLVPAHQVGLASALVGLFQVLGNGAGFAIGNLAIFVRDALAPTVDSFLIGTMALGALELATMLSVVYRVREGQAPRDRAGRSWFAIAREAWGTDILGERSFMWLLASRWFVLMGANALINTATFYAAQTLRLDAEQTGAANLLVLVTALSGTVLTVIPAGRWSNRIGRKPVIYIGCSGAVVGLAVIAVAPAIEVAALGAGLFGAGIGMFLAVDWALMTDLIPKESAGRYMGISNVATATSGIVMLMSGGLLMDFANKAFYLGFGPRLVFVLAVGFIIVGAMLLRPVDPRPREVRLAAEAAAG